ncbi:MAG: hypothetical protein LBK73_14185 [Treponema sp.]|nr:hypothetical protein [Treponema sp.]
MAGWLRTQADAPQIRAIWRATGCVSRSRAGLAPALTQEPCPYGRFDRIAVIVKKRNPKPAVFLAERAGFGSRYTHRQFTPFQAELQCVEASCIQEDSYEKESVFYGNGGYSADIRIGFDGLRR